MTKFKPHYFSLLAALAFAYAAPQDSLQRPFVSPIFGDDMVLQRGKPNLIWGWSQPGDAIRVEVGENSATATAGADGRWQARIQPGGPYTVKITGRQTVELHEVLVGDVWICAGQSNMQFGLAQARNGAEEVKNADHPEIRYYVVGQRVSYSHVDVPAGDRLAYCALAEHYELKVPYSGPTLSSVEHLPGALKLHFDHTDGGLVARGEKPAEFSIAGDDHKWYWADARIEGDSVIVSSKSVPDPNAVRYAWQSNPAATLFNGAGLPAAPFRTDDWPGITEGRQP